MDSESEDSNRPTTYPYMVEVLSHRNILYSLYFTIKTTDTLHTHFAGIFRHHKINTVADGWRTKLTREYLLLVYFTK
jgi:hypothetical protein